MAYLDRFIPKVEEVKEIKEEEKEIKNFSKEIKEFEEEMEKLGVPDTKRSEFVEELKHIERDNMSNMHLVMKMLHEVLTHLASIKNDTRETKEYMGKKGVVMLVVMVFASMAIGEYYQPYKNGMFDVFKNATSFISNK